MPKYEVDYSILERIPYTMHTIANNIEDGKDLAYEFAREKHGDEAMAIEIDGIREII